MKRAGRKHIGGYITDPRVLEQFAVLRARLDLDNSELLELAIMSLWCEHLLDRDRRLQKPG